MILLIFQSAENGPYLLVEATVCCSFCYGRQAEVEQTNVIVQSAYNSSIKRSAIAMNGRDCDILMHDTLGLLLSCDVLNGAVSTVITVSVTVKCCVESNFWRFKTDSKISYDSIHFTTHY